MDRNRTRAQCSFESTVSTDRKQEIITKGVFSLDESLESPKSLNSLEDGWTLLCFPQSRGSLESLEFSREWNFLKRPLFQKTPFSDPEFRSRELTEFCANLAEFCEKLGEFALTHRRKAERNSLGSLPGAR